MYRPTVIFPYPLITNTLPRLPTSNQLLCTPLHRSIVVPIALYLYPSPSTCTHRPLLVRIALYLYASPSLYTPKIIKLN